jgi:hypothetical protein
VVERREVPARDTVLCDETLVLTGAKAEERCPSPFSRIVVWDTATLRENPVLTSPVQSILLPCHDLRAWLDPAFAVPVMEPQITQLSLSGP